MLIMDIFELISPKYSQNVSFHLPNCLFAGGETVFQRRRRIIRERLLKEAGLNEADLEALEAEEAPLTN